MDFDLKNLMAQATQLTQGGRLDEATALLRSLMSGKGGSGMPTWPARSAASDTIDVSARRVDTPDIAGTTGITGTSTSGTSTSGTSGTSGTGGTGGTSGTQGASNTQGGFTLHSFANGADRRDYKLFVPTGLQAGPMPLVVMLHGCTQNPDDFAAGTRMNALAQQRGFVVLYPAQSRKASPQGCWNWFKHTHQGRERGEPALIAGMVRQVMGSRPIDPRRVYVAGLSAGGAMAAILGETWPDLFAAVGVHSGLAAGSARDLPSALAAMREGPAPRNAAGSGKPTIVFHGDADPTVHSGNARSVLAASIGTTAAAGRGEVSSVPGRRGARREVFRGADGRTLAELWMVHGAGHAWSGGGAGSYTDPTGPDASEEMLRFFLEHRLP